MDQRKENERNLYYKRIRAMSNKYSLPNSNKICLWKKYIYDILTIFQTLIIL